VTLHWCRYCAFWQPRSLGAAAADCSIDGAYRGYQWGEDCVFWQQTEERR